MARLRGEVAGVAEEVLGLLDARHFGPADVGLRDEAAHINTEGATFLDPNTPRL